VWTVEIGRQVRLLCPWSRHLTELPQIQIVYFAKNINK